ncbi:hypothetical protein HK101_012054, partial [Irineochytrium annulatum]
MAAPAFPSANGVESFQVLATTIDNVEERFRSEMAGMDELLSLNLDPNDPTANISQLLKHMDNTENALGLLESKTMDVLARLDAMLAEAGYDAGADQAGAGQVDVFDEGLEELGDVDEEEDEHEAEELELELGDDIHNADGLPPRIPGTTATPAMDMPSSRGAVRSSLHSSSPGGVMSSVGASSPMPMQ